MNSFERDNTEGIKTLNHEFGHSVQEKLLGGNYLLCIAIPSVITYWSNVFGSSYYSMPWERTADWFGGVNRGDTYYKENSFDWGIALLFLGVLTIPFYFIFGY